MKPNTEEEIKEIFKLYLNQQSTPKQEAALFDYINKHENTQGLFDEQINNAWKEDIAEPATERITITKNRTLPIWIKYAACLFLFCSLALSWYVIQQRPEYNNSAIVEITKTTRRGEKLKLLLPDSSVVYLNAMSKLSFPKRFEPGKKREIKLEGEAFFEVKHDTSRPFIVHSGTLQTRVLGTSFNINAYADNKTYSVSVRTGKVGVSEANKDGQKQLSLLLPGKHLVYNLASKKYTIMEQRTTDFNSWTTNRFIFKNETLGNILTSLKRSYLVDFKINSPKLLSCRFNATFTNQNIKEIADQLQTMSGGGIHYKFNQNNTIITFWGEACQ
ncbi:FecR family protein [Pedobacter hiemivivus]|uniref:FecR family protein n=1 Tax=Pedobacter hiemivivus TaxID=2530454 RepID=A0A4R0MYR1_9SPHI|nr:FecR family protein [Pedobacter hiemivivus]TCC92489.1 FecR family protein [Pedobacter hiemivivus]